MSTNTVYLITGANRGIGKGLVAALLVRPSTTIIAAVRDTESSTSKSLSSLPTGQGSKIVLAKIDSSDHTTPAKAIEGLQGIDKIDVVIANAGIGKYYGAATETPVSEVREHFEINTVAPLVLFQATHKLLAKSSKPIFLAVSTGVSTITDMHKFPLPVTAYGSSKAALNYIVRKIHFENEQLISFVINPGWVQTDMGNMGAKFAGMEAAPVTVEDSIKGILNRLDNATREETSGTFADFADDTWGW